MEHRLMDSRTGKAPIYDTALQIIRENGYIHFHFTAHCSTCFSPYPNYNDDHFQGDVCEIFIGAGPERNEYYEIELSPAGGLFLAKVTNHGLDPENRPILDLCYIERENCFVDASVEKIPNGYKAAISVDESALSAGNDDIFFNAYRIETEGRASDLHLFALSPTLQPTFHIPQSFVPLKAYI